MYEQRCSHSGEGLSYVPLDFLATASPSNGLVGRLMISNFKQSFCPSNISKGTLTGATRKSAHQVDPPSLFLKHKVVWKAANMLWPLKPMNFAC